MSKSLLIGTALVALLAACGADAQRGRRAPIDPYAAANNHTLDMKPTGSHSRSRPLDELVAMGALTSADVQGRRTRESRDLSR